MRRLLKWAGYLVLVVVILIVVAAAAIYGLSERSFRRSYDIQPAMKAVATGDSASIERGRHIATIRGCVDCHTPSLGGQTFFDDPVMGRLSTSNLTSGRNGIGSSYSDEDWFRAIRHGVRPDGKPLLFMPSEEFQHLSDNDVADVVAYIRSVPPVDSDHPPNRMGPLARVLFVSGQLPLVPAELIDHSAGSRTAPRPGPTAEYGRYLASGCVGCHGDGYSGGKIPGVPPDWPPARNISPDPQTGIGAWSEQDFFRALREGKLPDGTQMNPDYMPWRLTAAMTDDEIRAIWLYLNTLPPRAGGNR